MLDNLVPASGGPIFFDDSMLVLDQNFYIAPNLRGLADFDFERIVPAIVSGRYELFNTLYYNIIWEPELISVLDEVIENAFSVPGYVLANVDCLKVLGKLEVMCKSKKLPFL